MFADHTDKYFLILSPLFSARWLWRFCTARIYSDQQHLKLTHHSIWATSAHISPSDKHSLRLTRSLPHTWPLLPSTFTNRFRCHALQKPDVCWLLNKLTVYWETYRTHTHTLPCNKQQQKVILLVFASDNSGSQSKKCSEWLPTPVVKLTCTHNATPHVFGGQLWLVQ